MRTLQVGDRPTRLAQAVAEIGRIDKTIHLLTSIDDESKRRQILTQLNRDCRAPVRRKGYRRDLVGVPGKRAQFPARRHIPQLQRVVPASRERRAPVGRKGYGKDFIDVPELCENVLLNLSGGASGEEAEDSQIPARS
jgi:hypothetical protein